MHIARTRIAPPPIPATFVPRPRLLDTLDGGDERALTLVSAPPGYGKSLLLAHWARTRTSVPTAWLTVEQDDEDPRRLWSGVLTALIGCGGVPPDSRLHRLIVSRTAVELDFLADLVDALDALPTRIRLIVDDAHNLVSAEALFGLQMLMRSPRPRLRLVLATRRDPGLPVARMRLEEQLCELRAEQLRFSAVETSSLLERHGIRLSSTHAAVLHERTDGWAASLRLAALQLRGHPDPGSFIASFSGDERPVADYLIGEVLDRMTDDEREVLRSTSLCDPLPAGLAVELSGREDAAEMLDRLEHDTGLVVGTGPQRADYRIQQLLRSYLIAELTRSGPERVADLHRRAARWCSAEARPLAALHHAALAPDSALLRGLLGRWAPELAARGENGALLRALSAADEHVTGGDPWRAVVSAQLHLALGDRGQVAADVDMAKGSDLSASPDLALLLASTERLSWLHSDPLDGELEPDDPALAAIASAGRAAARLAAGAAGAARADVQIALNSARRLGLGLLEVQCLCLLGAAAWADGDYRMAAAAGSAGTKAAALGDWQHSIWAAGARAVSAHAALMRGQPSHALRDVEDGLRLAPPELDPVVRFALRAARGGALSDSGDPSAGLLELQQARAELGGAKLPSLLAATAAVLEHRAALLSGHSTAAGAALSWLTDRGSGRLEQMLMRAWAEAAAGGHQVARAIVRPLLTEEEGAQLPSTVVEAGLVDAGAALRAGDRQAARRSLQVALSRAEALDAVRPFAVAGPEVRALLVDQLGDVEDHCGFAFRACASDPRVPLSHGTRLSAREREVLCQLPSLLNLEEIADRLAVSLNTVKSHVRAIYGKLGVSSRRTAVLAAQEHGLLI
jgi:LuxR family maltose regulon positive regulatory protein